MTRGGPRQAGSICPAPAVGQGIGRQPGCVFCAIAAGQAPATIVARWESAIAIKPRGGGVHPGHVLVIARAYVADVGESPAVSAQTMACAAQLAAAPPPAANVITSKGADATQSIFHLHIPVVPRRHRAPGGWPRCRPGTPG